MGAWMETMGSGCPCMISCQYTQFLESRLETISTHPHNTRRCSMWPSFQVFTESPWTIARLRDQPVFTMLGGETIEKFCHDSNRQRTDSQQGHHEHIEGLSRTVLRRECWIFPPLLGHAPESFFLVEWPKTTSDTFPCLSMASLLPCFSPPSRALSAQVG